jgi:hypothetical protein
MLNDLRKYDCLGTPNYFFELLNNIKNNLNGNWSIADLQNIFYNRIVDNRQIIDGGIDLALRLNILEQTGTAIIINSNFVKQLDNMPQMIDEFNHYLFNSLKEDKTFLQIFSSENLSFDIIYKSLQLDNEAFGFKYSNFKQLLLDFNVLSKHPNLHFNHYILNQQYKSLFDKAILPDIKKREIGIEEFKKSMELQQKYGEEAEKFVVKFETVRLYNVKKVDWVAEYIVNAGYDIASYNSSKDEVPNRFIEVKSYDGPKPYFYWSRNEYLVAKLKGNQYWLYLVNRSKICNDNYKPEKIQNPFHNVLGEHNIEWIEEVDKYKITANS